MDQFIMVDTGSKRKKGESVAESQGSRRAWRKLQRRDPCMDEEPPHGGATGGGVGRGGSVLLNVRLVAERCVHMHGGGQRGGQGQSV